jgi:hypothetical protein
MAESGVMNPVPRDAVTARWSAGIALGVMALGVIALVAGTLSCAGGADDETGEPQAMSRRDMERFRSLPYVTHVENDPSPEVRGVSLHDEALACPGLNLLTSNEVGGAHLLDMDGEILHSWLPGDAAGDRWLYSEMDPEGNLLVIVVGLGLVKLDWDSNVIWASRPAESPLFGESVRPQFHHDFQVTDGGDIIILGKEIRRVRYPSQKKRQPYEIRDNSLVVLAPDGTPRKKVSFHDVLGSRMEDTILGVMTLADEELRKRRVVPTQSYDVFHANTVEVIDRDIGIARRGDVLFCIRNLDLIGILDVEKEEVVWTWGPGIIERPHHPSLLESGNILLFDNGYAERGYSRVVEVDPLKESIVWEYMGDPPESFFSDVMGGCQRLPNGNTLITESTRGCVFEVTPGGEKVWEFRDFEVSTKKDAEGKRATIYRMLRYPPDHPAGSGLTGR